MSSQALIRTNVTCPFTISGQIFNLQHPSQACATTVSCLRREYRWGTVHQYRWGSASAT